MARILVVDDERGIRGALAQILEYEGHETRTAADGAEGLALAAEFRPHVTFLDVKMPGMDGLAVLAKLREASPDAGSGDDLGSRDYLNRP